MRSNLEQLLDLLADELNVKEVVFVEEESELVQYQLLPLNRVLGPKFGPRFPLVRKALASLPAAKAVALLNAGQVLKLKLEDGSDVYLNHDEILVQTKAREGYGVAGEGGLVVALDTALTPLLEEEGLARELVRRIQELRKQADYNLTDRIVVQINTEGKLLAALKTFEKAITDEVLASRLQLVESPQGDQVLEDNVDGHHLLLAVKQAD
jgi:isoleucyl-tRNA synthetase